MAACMKRALAAAFFAISLLLTSCLNKQQVASARIPLSASTASAADQNCRPPLIVFGASFSDTGENAEAMPMRSAAEFPPYGLDYFPVPNGRWSNGRVITDFIAQGLGYPLLDPYLRSVANNYRHGVNFASAGSTARNTTVSGNGTSSSGLFSLSVQVDQFRRFKSRVLRAQSQNHGSVLHLPTARALSEAIYYVQSGQNDYINTAFWTPSFDSLTAVNTTISAIEYAVRGLYMLGARNIVLMNIIPLGCAPAFLSEAKALSSVPLRYDKDGCWAAFNQLVQLHNAHLQDLVNTLRVQLRIPGLVVFDAYSIYLDAVRNPSTYGIRHPFTACCGAGGGKFNLAVRCGSSALVNGTLLQGQRCEKPSEYISWDGLHPVESFAKHIADGVLTGSHLTPSFTIADACKA